MAAPIDKVDKVVKALANEFTRSRLEEIAIKDFEKGLFLCSLIRFRVKAWTSWKVESLNVVGYMLWISRFLRENTFAQQSLASTS